MKTWRLDLRLLNWFDNFRSNYWFWPLTACLGAFIVLHLSLWLDNTYHEVFSLFVPPPYKLQTEGARAFLTTVSASIMTATSVTLSLTILTVSHAVAQYSPRLLGNFMKSSIIQLTLSLFLATFIYCIALLSKLPAPLEKAMNVSVPNLSLFIATILTLACIVTLIAFFHQVPQSIRLANIVNNLGEKLSAKIDFLFAERNNSTKKDYNELNSVEFPEKKEHIIYSKKAGYLQTIEDQVLVKLTKKHDFYLEVLVRPGYFVTIDQPLAVYTSEAKRCDKNLSKQIHENFVIGWHRTETQDFLFLADQLIEIVIKALSPGINDPSSARSALNWLNNAIICLLRQRLPSPYKHDDDDTVRLIVPSISLDYVIAHIYEQLNPYVATDSIAAIHQMKIYNSLKKKIISTKNYSHTCLTIQAEALFSMAKDKNLPQESLKTLEEYATKLKTPMNGKLNKLYIN